MTSQIIKESITLKHTSDITSDEVLLWGKRVEVQRPKTTVLGNLKECTKFNPVKGNVKEKLKYDNKKKQADAMLREHNTKCKYCRLIHQPWQSPAYCKICNGCGKTKHIMNIYRLTKKDRTTGRPTHIQYTKNKAVYKIQRNRYTHDTWSETHEEDIPSLDSVTMKSFSINRPRSVICTKLEKSSKHAKCHTVYKVDTGSDVNLLSIDVFRNCSQISPLNS